jgi:hypothetical protein
VYSQASPVEKYEIGKSPARIDSKPHGDFSAR